MINWNKNKNKYELGKEPSNYKKIFDNFQFLLLLRDALGVTKTLRIVRNNLLRNGRLLSSKDTQFLYDKAYIAMIGSHKSIKIVNGYPITKYSAFAFDYLNEVSVKQKKTVIDFGSGSGELCFALASVGFNVIGLEINPTTILHCNKLAKKDGLEHTLRFSQISDVTNDIVNNCDYIILSDVAEHLSVSELKKLFELFSRKLNEKGRLIVRTPNGYLNPMCRNKLVLADVIYNIKLLRTFFFSEYDQLNILTNTYYSQTHINVMTPSELSALLKQAGFDNVNVTYFRDLPLGLNKLRLSGSIGVIAGH